MNTEMSKYVISGEIYQNLFEFLYKLFVLFLRCWYLSIHYLIKDIHNLLSSKWICMRKILASTRRALFWFSHCNRFHVSTHALFMSTSFLRNLNGIENKNLMKQFCTYNSTIQTCLILPWTINVTLFKSDSLLQIFCLQLNITI